MYLVSTGSYDFFIEWVQIPGKLICPYCQMPFCEYSSGLHTGGHRINLEANGCICK